MSSYYHSLKKQATKLKQNITQQESCTKKVNQKSFLFKVVNSWGSGDLLTLLKGQKLFTFISIVLTLSVPPNFYRTAITKICNEFCPNKLWAKDVKLLKDISIELEPFSELEKDDSVV